MVNNFLLFLIKNYFFRYFKQFFKSKLDFLVRCNLANIWFYKITINYLLIRIVNLNQFCQEQCVFFTLKIVTCIQQKNYPRY